MANFKIYHFISRSFIYVFISKLSQFHQFIYSLCLYKIHLLSKFYLFMSDYIIISFYLYGRIYPTNVSNLIQLTTYKEVWNSSADDVNRLNIGEIKDIKSLVRHLFQWLSLCQLYIRCLCRNISVIYIDLFSIKGAKSCRRLRLRRG